MTGPTGARPAKSTEVQLQAPFRQPKQRKPKRPERQEIVYGRVARIEASYAREVRVPSPILMIVLAAAGLVRAAGQLLGRLLSAPRPGTGRGWKDLRKGPEFQVTPVLIRDPDNRLVPLEIHGYVSASGLINTDRVRVHVRWQRDPALPPRAVRIENLTTGRMLTPRGATLWSHLGIGLMLQALLGVALLTLCLLCLLGRL